MVEDYNGGLAQIRAFRKLDTIKEQVIWWEAGAQPPRGGRFFPAACIAFASSNRCGGGRRPGRRTVPG
ncbi:MAG: hypothetical protein F4059_10480 [Gemmatimonadetes bacterium]|nr:hypothetical protein [Gemmatimonadota bacterium]